MGKQVNISVYGVFPIRVAHGTWHMALAVKRLGWSGLSCCEESVSTVHSGMDLGGGREHVVNT